MLRRILIALALATILAGGVATVTQASAEAGTKHRAAIRPVIDYYWLGHVKAVAGDKPVKNGTLTYRYHTEWTSDWCGWVKTPKGYLRYVCRHSHKVSKREYVQRVRLDENGTGADTRWTGPTLYWGDNDQLLAVGTVILRNADGKVVERYAQKMYPWE